MFGLSEKLYPKNIPPAFLKGRNLLLSTARAGIALLVERLAPSQVWFPSYLCEAMLAGIGESRARIRFYAVDGDLRLLSLDWIEEVKEGDIVVMIDYFGFTGNLSCASLVKGRGAWIVEDACQALLSEDVGKHADFVLYSPRKFVGVPDGGIIVLNSEVEIGDVPSLTPPADWWLKAFYATLLRREFDLYGGDRRWFVLFQEIEASAPVGQFGMSDLSRNLLRCGFDYPEIAKRRIQNYQALLGDLEPSALFPDLPRGIVPLGFPIRVKNRDQLRQTLFTYQIYPPVHWPIKGIVPAAFHESHALAAEIMTLPCDQRYDIHDMKRMAQIVLEEIYQ
jgi:dTDP-4-amino-4,6-dideoxygalactose transaminase